MNQNTWERIYFEKPYDKPFLFYAIFGTDNMDRLTVSKSRHNIDGKPEELKIINYSKSNGEAQKKYIEEFYDDWFGHFLKKKNEELYRKVANCNNITVVTGEFDDNSTLNYLKNTVGIVQAITETNITAVLDLQIIEWFEKEEWSDRFFAAGLPNVFKHVRILLSDDNNRIWLHTRGMRKFGRPDLSIRNLTPDKKETATELINRFVEAFAYGMIPDETKEIRIKGMERGVYGKILGNYENPDFNNFYFEIEEI